jgi:hypothetical protein
MERIRQTDLTFEHRIIRTLMAGGLCLGFMILFIVPPADLPFTCVFHSVTGHSCLTCGMTRSLHAMSHGDLIASFRYHLFGPAVFIGMFLCFLIFTVDAIRGKRLTINAGFNIRRPVVMMLAIVLLVYWGTRLFSEIGV